MLLMILPSNDISPLVMSSNPAIILNKVDLPHPLGPTNTTNSPFSIFKDVSSTALVPLGYILVIFCNSKKLIIIFLFELIL